MKIQEIESVFRERELKLVADWEGRVNEAKGRVNYVHLCVCFGISVLVIMLVQQVV
jgi:hypothetical protein